MRSLRVKLRPKFAVREHSQVGVDITGQTCESESWSVSEGSDSRATDNRTARLKALVELEVGLKVTIWEFFEVVCTDWH